MDAWLWTVCGLWNVWPTVPKARGVEWRSGGDKRVIWDHLDATDGIGQQPRYPDTHPQPLPDTQ